MKRAIFTVWSVGLGFALSGCINPLPGSVGADASDPAALALLAASAEAHGGDANFAAVEEIDVRYDGEWLNNVWKLQPMLVDRGFRKASTEAIVYGGPPSYGEWPVVIQEHTGPEGKKTVVWPSALPPDYEPLDGGAAVFYNDQPIKDTEERVRQEEASAMVAEAYRMFLTGPFYFTQRSGSSSEMVAVMSEPDTVLGAACDQVLVELRPGFGTSEVDRVQVAIDRDTKFVRRVRFSLDGFRKTAGATADVELDGYTEIDGLVFPTRFLEIVTHPIDREVHRWEAKSIEVHRVER
ncbi:MAG: hypothetical protein AAF333_14990 [Planctomycetota bacterium]